jgi:hypothetical protein
MRCLLMWCLHGSASNADCITLSTGRFANFPLPTVMLLSKELRSRHPVERSHVEGYFAVWGRDRQQDPVTMPLPQHRMLSGLNSFDPG